MLLKGYPRISESFISTEILLLESLGIPINIYSLRQPREPFSHDHVGKIKAPVLYLPEYVLPHWQILLQANASLRKRIGPHYLRCFRGAVRRALERKKLATLRHFLQAGYLVATGLVDYPIRHLHAHFCHTPTSVALFASELTGIPFSFTAHAKDIYTSEPDQLSRKIERARFVVTCTKYNAEYLKRLAPDCTTPVHTIYHGIDLDLFRFNPSPPPPPPYRILSVGRLVPKKGYDDLLRALKLLDSAGFDFQFIHIGSGEMEQAIRRMVGELRLTERVQLLGTLPHSRVIEHYRSAHCFALACKVAPDGDRDGIPNVLAEAMAIGVPVVATSVSAISELVSNGQTGTLVQPDDPDELMYAIKYVLTRRTGLDLQLARARQKVEEDFDNRRCISRLYTLFEEILKEP
jgi:glycosyltransferase involved in cell wall biosynthesis